MKVICINDQHRPAEFPANKWIKEGQPYTVVKVLNMAIQGGLGFVLEEIDMNGCEPYVSFGAWRFGIPQEQPEEELTEELELTTGH